MLVMSIHCAGANCDVALIQSGKILAREFEPMKRGHDQRLPMLTQSVVSSARQTLKDVDCFAVCVGPGSFTGIRVGVAFARGLALSNGSKAVGVTSLEAMSLGANNSPALAILPAKQRLPDISFWTQGFHADVISDPMEIGSADLPQYGLPGMIGLAPEANLADARTYAPELDWRVASSDAVNVALYAAENPGSVRTASPVYVREPDAVPAKPLA